ncbi:hypothetical protein LSM04_002256 [Trypanosoma melophagium]|uniref:uncharacterized protein n=1 Tax=Trypanosoma melophagium TaxID=715481 RepID=UPI00351A6C5C|nr:hypothetical protein LSM04_002256 [Trypanosoma melophagium]
MHAVTCPPAERKRPRADEPITEGSAFPCDKCEMIARSKTGLKAHIRARHPEDPSKDAPGTQLIPQPASLRCEFCLRDFGNIGALSCHKKQKHPPGTPILPNKIKVTFPRNKKRQRDSLPPEREDRGKVQCGIQCMSKSGLTQHRMPQHGHQRIRAHTSQRTGCEETALYLLSCPALRPLRMQYAITDIPLQKLCFSKQLAQFLLAVERNYAIPQTSRSRTPTPPSSNPLRPLHPSKASDELDYGIPDRISLKRHLSRSPTSNKKQRRSFGPNH